MKSTLFQRVEVDAARDQYMTILHRYLHQKGEPVETKVYPVKRMYSIKKGFFLQRNYQ